MKIQKHSTTTLTHTLPPSKAGHVNVLFKNERCENPRVSFVLLDWSCRESLHILNYLNQQTVPREQYEVIWIEYYQRVSPEIEEELQKREGRPPIVDQWAVMGMPDTVYYHKHLMYNVGLVLSRGEIVIFCDSDAMVRPTFVEEIIRAFERDPEIVLHMDEVRNNDRRFHPFNYPSFEEVVGSGAINWTGSTTTGLVDRADPLHSRNYGACMGARREDLIAIGGADEHIDYLGHICGPYEMTFRLVNAGKREVWHPAEFLYHVWHPGQAGERNFLGPHDGRHMSTTALEARRSSRILPLVENPAIEMMRLKQDEVQYTSFLDQVVPEAELEAWGVSGLGKLQKPATISRDIIRHPLTILLLIKTSVKILVKQAFLKTTQLSRRANSSQEMLRKIFNTYRFVKSVLQHNFYVIQRSRQCLKELTEQEVAEVAVYGATDIAEILYALTPAYPITITGIYDDFRGGRFMGFNILPLEGLQDHIGKVIIASLFEMEDSLAKLKKLGIERHRILLLQ